ncbi:OmpA family protein [Myxococcota bacterium]|nr:OmpA family protein [Myxococcota bacterium]
MIPLLLLLTGCPHTGDTDLVQQLDREVIALRKKNQVLEEQLQACGQGELETALYAQLVQVFSGTEVTVHREGARAAVVIPGELLFAPGSTEVRDEAAMVSDLLATALNLHPQTQVWIIGHTDDDPLSGSLKRRFGDNWGLAAGRAQAFMRVLVDRFGVAEARFSISGRGPVHPIATNDTPEGRALNRRIVVVVGPPEDFR